MVRFYFDPSCPWTWLTSRWLVGEADRRGEPIDWRSYSLALAADGAEVPEQYRAAHAMSTRFLRVVEALRADGRNDDIAHLYTALGTRMHDQAEGAAPQILDEVCQAVGLADVAAAADDASWDKSVQASNDEAHDLVGPELGSPILAIGEDPGRGMFGPVVTARLNPQTAANVWDATMTLIEVPEVAELKRGRGIRAAMDPVVSG